MDTDRVVDVMGIVAGLGALAIVVGAWPRRRTGAVRDRHPSAGPPFSLSLDPAEPAWRFSVRHGRPPVAIDIVSHRPSGFGPWTGEPFVEPVLVAPGTPVTIPATVDSPALAHDVVVAWTSLHPAGAVQGSMSLVVGGPAHAPVAAPAQSGRTSQVVFGAIGLFLTLITMVLGLRLFDDGRGASVTPAASATTMSEPTVSTDTTPATTPPAQTSPATSADPPTSITTTTTTVASTTKPPITTSSTASTSTATTTRASTAPVTTAPDGPRVLVDARVEDCRFGTDCLIVGFALDGFDASGTYVCEFADGSRFEFRYIGDRADDACATGGGDPSITIEVDGVRSRTVTRDQLTGG